MKTSSFPISSPKIFDHSLREKRFSRFSSQDDFLGKLIAEQTLHRMSFIKRQFFSLVILGQDNELIQGLKEQGHGCNFIQSSFCREELPFDWNSLNLVINHLNLQWINDLPGFLWRIRHILQPDGLFLGTLLGGETLHELRHSLLMAEIELSGGASPRVIPMIDLYSASQLLLRADFRLPVADREIIKVSYKSIFNLISDLRKMNLTNVLFERNKRCPPRKLFSRAEEIYQEHFGDSDGRIIATFEVIYLAGWSPHENQQKALKPGSATLRLKQVLG